MKLTNISVEFKAEELDAPALESVNGKKYTKEAK